MVRKSTLSLKPTDTFERTEAGDTTVESAVSSTEQRMLFALQQELFLARVRLEELEGSLETARLRENLYEKHIQETRRNYKLVLAKNEKLQKSLIQQASENDQLRLKRERLRLRAEKIRAESRQLLESMRSCLTQVTGFGQILQQQNNGLYTSLVEAIRSKQQWNKQERRNRQCIAPRIVDVTIAGELHLKRKQNSQNIVYIYSQFLEESKKPLSKSNLYQINELIEDENSIARKKENERLTQEVQILRTINETLRVESEGLRKQLQSEAEQRQECEVRLREVKEQLTSYYEKFLLKDSRIKELEGQLAALQTEDNEPVAQHVRRKPEGASGSWLTNLFSNNNIQ